MILKTIGGGTATGFTEADGHFGIKIVENQPKSEGKDL
jgi:hypothetical protein